MISSCRKGKEEGRRQLYEKFYGYAIGLCLRYANSREEAQEILNDGFIKVFKHINSHKSEASFKAWMRRIMINAAIDHYRKYQAHYHSLEISYAAQLENRTAQLEALDQLSREEILRMVQQLPPSYRMVFNLYAIEGYSHNEIATKLDISTGTSKSNLAKARMKLRKMMKAVDDEYEQRYG